MIREESQTIEALGGGGINPNDNSVISGGTLGAPTTQGGTLVPKNTSNPKNIQSSKILPQPQ